jgi:hypothetical protein
MFEINTTFLQLVTLGSYHGDNPAVKPSFYCFFHFAKYEHGRRYPFIHLMENLSMPIDFNAKLLTIKRRLLKSDVTVEKNAFPSYTYEIGFRGKHDINFS